MMVISRIADSNCTVGLNGHPESSNFQYELTKNYPGVNIHRCGKPMVKAVRKIIYPLVICYIAIENDHRNRGFSH